MYVVIEFMLDKNGDPGSFTYTYADLPGAKAKFHTVMAAAALSDTQIHGAAILTEDMFLVQSDSCRHE